jgi:hypothetical protein
MIVDEGILDRTIRIARVHALETMPRNPSLLEGKLNRLRVVLEGDTEESDAGVEPRGSVGVVRELKKLMCCSV